MTDSTADTGNRRRSTDAVSTDESLELLASLAYEYALKNEEIDLEIVEVAIVKCRGLKVEPTGSYPILKVK